MQSSEKFADGKNMMRIITRTIGLLTVAVFSCEFSSFILCTDPLVLKNTESKAKHSLHFPHG